LGAAIELVKRRGFWVGGPRKFAQLCGFTEEQTPHLPSTCWWTSFLSFHRCSRSVTPRTPRRSSRDLHESVVDRRPFGPSRSTCSTAGRENVSTRYCVADRETGWRDIGVSYGLTSLRAARLRTLKLIKAQTWDSAGIRS